MADTLAIDAAKARKAGVSYGKWKATQPYRTRPEELPEELPEEPHSLDEYRTRECAFCKVVFEYRRIDQIYCCKKCCALAKYYRDKEAGKNV